MTSRSRNAVRSYETEIEKSREESNWKKVVDLAQQLKARSHQHESLAHFLIGEGKLEAYLNEWPPIKENIERAQRELSEARGYLTLATDELGTKAGVALDSHLLLGKLNYACGSYEDSLKHYKLAELNTLTEKELPVRSLRIVAESYAIKGLCLEQTTVPGSSRYKQAEWEAEMIRNFELASDLTLLYLQKTNSSNIQAGPTLETALQRVPLMHIRAGRLQNAIDRYREILSAVESYSTQALRLTITMQLAEVLLRGVTGQVYSVPEKMPSQPQPGTLSRRREDHVAEGPWKPKRYAALNQFVPRSECEEIILVLLIGEAMAVRDAVLSQSPEFEALRARSHARAAAVCDLLALAAARWGQLCLLAESLERAMKFSFGRAHVWRQRALAAAALAPAAPPAPDAALGPAPAAAAAAAAGPAPAAVRAAAVLREARRLRAADGSLRLLAAANAYDLGEIDEGILLAEEAVEIEEAQDGFMLARCYLYAGMGYQIRAQNTNSRIDKQAANDRSLKLLLKSVELDSNDHLSMYHLALQYIHLGMYNDAMDATRGCLGARASCAGGLRLAWWLWARRGAAAGARAALAAELARDHHPALCWPRAALAYHHLHRPEKALTFGKELLMLARGSAEAEAEAEPDGPAYCDLDARSDSAHDRRSHRDAGSALAAAGAGAGAGAGGAWEAASSASSRAAAAGAAAGARRAGAVAEAWLLLAKICLRLGRVSAASGCVAEAALLQPHSHLVLYTRGLVQAARGDWEPARRSFRDALAVRPTHLASMLGLGGAYHALGWARLAERALREAAALRPARADTWRRLALVLAALGDHDAAADCAAAALDLVAAAPARAAAPLL